MTTYKSLELLAQMHINPELVQKHIPDLYRSYVISLINTDDHFAWRCFRNMKDEESSWLVIFKRLHGRSITEDDIPQARCLAEYVISTLPPFEKSILADTPYPTIREIHAENNPNLYVDEDTEPQGVCDAPTDELVQMLAAPAKDYKPEIITDSDRQRFIQLGREYITTDPKKAYHYFDKAEDKEGLRETGKKLMTIDFEYACFAFEKVNDCENLSRVGTKALEVDPVLAYRAFTSAEDKEGLKKTRTKLVETDLAKAYWIFDYNRVSGPKYKRDEEGLLLLANIVIQSGEIELPKILQLLEIVPHEADHMSTIYTS